MSNESPRANSKDQALWSRLIYITFPFRFVHEPNKPYDKPRDDGMKAKLLTEAPGILASFIQGSQDWREKKLALPQSVKDDTAIFRFADDSIDQFLRKCTKQHREAEVRSTDLFKAYETFCAEEGISPEGKKAFFAYVTEDFKKDKDYKGIYFVGLKLKDEPSGQG
jgi:putative DNA primase/helicase